MIYLNNAATSYPKPQEVAAAVVGVLREPPCEPGRGTCGGQDILSACRRSVARVLGVKDEKRIFFTSGATESFNLIVRGLDLENGSFVVTAAEHNALLRPLFALVPESRIHILKPNASGKIQRDDVAAAFQKHSAKKYLFVNHCSNVTGTVQDIPSLAKTAHAAGALLITDVSQSAGAMPMSLEDMGVDMAVFTGHKALMGPEGTGGFWLREGIELKVSKWGGTGFGKKTVFDVDEPVSYEVGTQNLCGLAGLAAGADYIWQQGLDQIQSRLLKNTEKIEKALKDIHGVTVYTKYPESGILSFNIDALMPADVGYILFHVYGIDTRTGYHCAPFMADVLGTPHGTVRVSLSCMTSDESIDVFIEAVKEIAGGI